jgi:large subunit ribosomal protein L6
MSRIGKLPIPVPAGVDVTVTGNHVTVTGGRGTLERSLPPAMIITVDGGVVTVARPTDATIHRAMHGLTRTLVANMVQGVTTGFSRSLDISGVGYKAELKGKEIHLALGFSHIIVYPLPDGVTAQYDAKANRLTVAGADKHQIGLVASEIRKLRPPEPYKGKGVKYAEETIRRKQGKTGAA